MLINSLWILSAFICGALPLSYWVGRVFLRVDIRAYGDGNPGATNVWKAGGRWWGMLAVILDTLKGLVPVALAIYLGGLEGWNLILVALAPLLGHAYTPFLGFQGGKALAATFGVWTALTLYEVPLVFGLSLGFWLWLLRSDGWAIAAGLLTLFVYLLVWHPELELFGVWAGSSMILMWRYRDSLLRRPQARQSES